MSRTFSTPSREQQAAVSRVRRNFWSLAAATVVAVGVLSDAVARPASPSTAALVALSGLAALISVTLAGRILVVSSRVTPPRSRRTIGRRHS